MEKTINFGKVDATGSGRDTNLITIDIRLEEKEAGKPVLSISGDIWNGNHSDIIQGGQCLDTIAQYVSDPLFDKVYRLWKLYHLNNLNAGTPEQTQALEAANLRSANDYKAACEYLRSIDLYEVQVDGAPFKYGHRWLYRAIPSEDLKLIKEIIEG